MSLFLIISFSSSLNHFSPSINKKQIIKIQLICNFSSLKEDEEEEEREEEEEEVE